jgi:hypothetical protein
MNRRFLSILAIAALLTLALVGVAAAKTKTKSKSVSVAAHKTRIVTVAFPDALKQGDAKYKCSASVTDGDPSKVKISKGPAEGGSVCQAKIQNNGSASVTVKVTAKTTE